VIRAAIEVRDAQGHPYLVVEQPAIVESQVLQECGLSHTQ